jgi:hypothetical protein
METPVAPFNRVAFFFRVPTGQTWRVVVMFLVLVMESALSPSTAQPLDLVDNSIYANLLDRHVKKNRVDYDGFKREEALLDRYLEILSATDVGRLSHSEKFAFYINAYNAFTIKLILTKYPGINSIKEIGSFFSNPWSKKFIRLGGQTISLDTIEHDFLRPIFKDPRVHFAINCASKGCPPLLNQPYEGKTLEVQLDTMTRAFINDTRQTFLKDNTLFVSKIFKWFEQDFNDAPLLFIRQYADTELKKELDRAGPNIKLSYLDYDWTLNR